jgi:hypothetical protein
MFPTRTNMAKVIPYFIIYSDNEPYLHETLQQQILSCGQG